jgi:A/G-specific adenine glycosylase
LDKARTRPGYDHASEDEASFESDDSRASSYKDTSKRKTHRKRHKSRHGPTEPDNRLGSNCNPPLHSRSSHDIQSPDSIRAALLRWYAGVHASRGMPWRKPHDPSHGIEERAQRAYEVCVLHVSSRESSVNDLWGRCGCQKLCSSKLKFPRLSPTIPVGWRSGL